MRVKQKLPFATDATSLTAYARMAGHLVSGISGFKVTFTQVPTAVINVATKEVRINIEWTALPPDELVAVLLHECAGHAKRTAVFPVNTIKNRLEGAFTNVLEDLRIELAVMSDWPGARRLLDKLATRVFQPNKKRADNVYVAAINACLCWGRAAVLGQSRPAALAPAAISELLHYVQPKTWYLMQEVIRTVGLMPSDKSGTQHVLDAARKIIALLANDNVTAHVSADGSGGADEQATATSEGDSTAGDDSNVSGKPSTKSKITSPQVGETPKEASPSQEADASGSGKTMSEPESENSTEEELPNIDGVLVDLAQAVTMVTRGVKLDRHQESYLRRDFAACFPCTAVSRSDLEHAATRALHDLHDLFETMTSRARNGYATQGQKLDLHRAALARVHNFEAFETLSYGEGVDTAIALSIDSSGSMSTTFGNTDITYATAVASIAAAVVHIAHEYNVPTYVNAWDDAARRSLDWCEPLLPGRGLCATAGGTDLARGLADVVQAFATRKETNKILVILTDGDTDGSNACETILCSETFALLGVKCLYIQVKATTALGVALERRGHAVARADSFGELCSTMNLALKKLINGVYVDESAVHFE